MHGVEGVGLLFVRSFWPADDLQHGALGLRRLRGQRIVVWVLLSVRLRTTDRQHHQRATPSTQRCVQALRMCFSIERWESTDLSGETIGIGLGAEASNVSVRRLVGGLGLSAFVSAGFSANGSKAEVCFNVSSSQQLKNAFKLPDANLKAHQLAGGNETSGRGNMAKTTKSKV